MAGPSGNETNHELDGLTVRGGLALEGAGGVKTYLNRDVAGCAIRRSVAMKAAGYYAETFPIGGAATAAGTPMATGTIMGCLVGLLAGDVVSNVICAVGVGGSGFSGIGLKFGLYSKAGVLLASSADVSGSFGTAGKKTVAMGTPYTVLSDDGYYVAALAIASTTPALRRGSGAANDFGAATGGIAEFVIQASQTDLVAQATLTATAAYYALWLAVS